MNIFKHFNIIFLSLLMMGCGSNNGQKKSDFKLNTNSENNTFSNNETLTLSIENPKNFSIDSIYYSLNGKRIEESTPLLDVKLGKQTVEATVYFNNQHQSVQQNMIILNSEPPKIFTYKIINEYPHDITSYTQGLEFFNDTLYESTGQYKESKLKKVNYKTGEVLKNVPLADDYFGEGLTILNNKVYQLTWKNGTGFVYDVNTFKKLNSFKYGNSKEGWGLCNDSSNILKSDGTEKIWTLNPETLIEQDYIQVYTNKGKITEINEMEWIQGKIYANRYQKDGVAIINPKNGAVIGVIDFSPLKKLVTQHQGLDVLNGIAYNPKTKTVFVTGKRWDKLFEVEIVEN
ncbi:MAG: glutaminyl-peptide cyclotransferase [Flavobacteriales bacterium]|nr:glutaminyl-peptide cyclotransferase [Flavobacteriia bacterium]NCP06486.1 glutaminyl-peptide cyclotransferase [Flavobacteriales bacterium]PIV94427.1 MAG: glutamine cyclotransferase [Flavobacteriaceae bacterium CG17_big_fil_post_rev_8_21_14_2_50_33_15]PIY10434.1 MAG: glutamine cyclotransferase [Flavobacteriaceae bacterium CG_4_10_14_3_um_filter_33_47]PJB17608.1 MAG: glutamine cyclotransferase [Flavobacteriaceae bacterium CG_4_9_14_3_um_filter_33_16]